MKKLIYIFIVLVVCSQFAGVASETQAATYGQTCVITGYVNEIEAVLAEDHVVDSYKLLVSVLDAQLYSGQEYGDCEQYPGSEFNLVYAQEDFTKQAILKGNKIEANVTKNVLSDVFVFPDNQYNFTYAGFDGINLDDATAIKGYTMELFEKHFLFGITPKVLTGGGRFEFKEVVLGEDSGMVLPNGYTFASKIMEFDIKSKDLYDPAKPFWLQVKYNDDSLYEKSVFYFDQGKSTWIEIPSKVSTETGYVRAAFHLPFAKLAVLENTGVMNSGTASWYAYKGCDCAASPDYPKGTKLLVTNVDNGESVVVTVNDWGPERDIFPNRVIDLDVVAFSKIANKRMGLCNVTVVPYYE
ncbi:septal ring lytic transglycosylase RlpA family protein [Patescibacteria group bacterium]